MAVENKNALPDGTILKHGGIEYCIERFLGAGGFGITYKVRGSRKKAGQILCTNYAIKEHFMSQDCERESGTHSVVCSKPAKERVEEGKKDFIAEANRLKDSIQHSHIVRVHDVFEANKTAYYVMEYLDGRSLRSYIRKHGPCHEDEAIVLLLPIARAVGYLHDQRITHLDIKPDNIMIVGRRSGGVSPILIDFGLSKHYDKKGNPTSSIRVQATSDGYSPMEQYLGISDFQPTADIYALAATIVYCLTGKDPKRAADIRPGEMRVLLEGRISEAKLSALLNALNPSKFERTKTIRDFLGELCPDEDIESWETETDNNLTDQIFFKKKEKGFFSRNLKNLFGSWQKFKNIGGNSLNNPCGKYGLKIPVVMVVEIRRPKEMGLSKKVWFCKSRCNTVYTYYGDNQIHDEDFRGGFPEDVTKVLTTSGLLSSEHWEKEYIPTTSDGKGCLYVNITFHYNDGMKFERFNSGVYGTSRLLSAAENILNCESVAYFIFQDDIKLLEEAKTGKSANCCHLSNNDTDSSKTKDSTGNLCDFELNGIKILNFERFDHHDTWKYLASLYHIPQIFELLSLPENLSSNLRELKDQLTKCKIMRFPPDDETPISHFWWSIQKNSTDTLLLVYDEMQFIHAQKLQYQLRHQKKADKGFKIVNPVVLNALGLIVTLNSKALSLNGENIFKYRYGNRVCRCSVGGQLVEVDSLETIEKAANTGKLSSDNIIKGGAILNSIMRKELDGLFLLDRMEYDISLAIVADDSVKEFFTLMSSAYVPCKKSEEIPFDLVTGKQVYLHIGRKRININLAPYFLNFDSDGKVSFTVDIDADKCIRLSFNKGESISLGEILFREEMARKTNDTVCNEPL